MLQTIREKTTGWIATVIVGLLIIPFAFFGVNNYFSDQAQLWVAMVGEQEISQDTYRQRFEEYRQQTRQMMGERFDPSQLETPEAKRRVLDSLVEESLLRQAARDLGLAVSPRQLQDEIMKIDAFKLDGQFNPQQYRTLLASQGMTPLSFEQRLRDELEVRALPQALGRSTFATAAEVDQYFRMRDQKRDLRYVELPAPADEAIGEPDQAALEAYHAEHADKYRSEEKVSIEYLVVDPAGVEVPTSVDEDSLRERYEEQKARFTEIEQRLASHILIKVPEDAPAEEQMAAQARAKALVEQARAEGADFAALAREHSEDIGSKATGGDLGWIESGLTDPAFESALFAMEPGSISEPVKTSEGWHVIQLRELRPGDVKPFEAVRDEVEAEYLAGERERVISERAGRLVDITYRDPTTLAPAANELGLEIQTAGPFGRFGGEDPLSSHPEVLKAAFQARLIREKTSSDPIDLGDGRTMVLRVSEHQPSVPMALEEVRDQVAADWRRDRSRQLADQAAEALMAKWTGEATLESIATEAGLEVKTADDLTRNGSGIDPQLVEAAFEMPRPTDLAPQRQVVELGAGRRALLEVTDVTDGDPSTVAPAERQSMQDQLAQTQAATEVRELIELLKTRYEVKLAEQRL
ncbi:SurA N-terminal domain-containing protein [Pseudomarimonas salicorniae]|uniref:Periplasmic chaperone PpiD n=1 Tax=Pseudomarimonas salicorniae TaxID=2933270 RepID=A0ABT0GLZ3_9GAMM|nr:SurA N-terminal domain-containing protein [Lysobacter sp. CAU 1642]MCK7595571.1 SurA N-terminal domain-containing protein [Lysobacter sp. CAU 1642]